MRGALFVRYERHAWNPNWGFGKFSLAIPALATEFEIQIETLASPTPITLALNSGDTGVKPIAIAATFRNGCSKFGD